jgi:Ca2+-binding RTX toxin-like protein
VDAFVDVAVVLVNGQNVALFDHNPLAPLSVIGGNLAASYFLDNTDGHLPIEYDGVSARLKIIAPVVAGTNHIKIGIGDTGDHILDSGIFLANFTAGTLPGGGGVLIDQSGTKGSDGDDLIDLSGRSTDCVAEGLRGDDIILGGSGNDTLIGGYGKDLLRGNGGSDVFDYRAAEDWADQDRDTIDDFGGNTAALSNAASLETLNGDVLLVNWSLLAGQPDFVGTGFSAPTAGHYSTLTAAWLSSHADGSADAAHAQFVYDAASGLVSFDADGTGSASAVELTLIGTHPDSLATTALVIAG